MKPSNYRKTFIIGIFSALVFLVAGTAVSKVDPQYGGWAVGGSWGGYGTILRSTDSGKTWIRQGEGQIPDVNLSGVFAVDPYRAWVVGSQNNGYGAIYLTINGGRTWERKGSSNMASPDYVPDVEFLKVHARGYDVWTVGRGTILHSSDNGATWTNHIPEAYKDIELQGVFAVDHNTVWVTGGSDAAGHAVILKTTDAGLNWTRQTGTNVDNATHILGISAADADTAWAVGGNSSVLKTTDGGSTWTRDENINSIADINEVYAVNTSIVWVATDNTIYWTTDGGATWDNGINHGLSGSIAFMGISGVSAQKAWTSFFSFTGYIAYTTDGGTTWTKVEQLNGENLPGLMNISFAPQPVNNFPWELFVPNFTGKKAETGSPVRRPFVKE